MYLSTYQSIFYIENLFRGNWISVYVVQRPHNENRNSRREEKKRKRGQDERTIPKHQRWYKEMAARWPGPRGCFIRALVEKPPGPNIGTANHQKKWYIVQNLDTCVIPCVAVRSSKYSLTTPVSNPNCERVFSHLKNLYRKNRLSLSPNMVNSLMFLGINNIIPQYDADYFRSQK